jgi:hypothetical protein
MGTLRQFPVLPKVGSDWCEVDMQASIASASDTVPLQEKRCTRRDVMFERSTLQAAYKSAVFHRQDLT